MTSTKRLEGVDETVDTAASSRRGYDAASASAFPFRRATLFASVFVVGSVLLRIDSAYAARHPTTGLVFHLFWVAQIVVLVPVAIRMFSDAASRCERLALLSAFSLYEFVPKLLRDPGAPIFHDELSHWFQSEQVFSAGRPFISNSLLPILRVFPGLHTLTAALRSLTGMSTWHVGSVLIAVAHIVVTLGVWHLVERVTGSHRAAGVGALFFALNPGFMFFDSQYAYESLAIVFVVWAVALGISLDRPIRGWVGAGARRLEDSWRMRSTLLYAVVIVAACVVTHHLSSYLMCILLVFMALGALFAHRKNKAVPAYVSRTFSAPAGYGLTLYGPSAEPLGPIVCLASIAVVLAGTWLFVVAPRTFAYLTPHLSGGIAEVFRLISNEQSARQLFRQSPVPSYERLASFVTPAFLLMLAAISVWNLRKRWRTVPGRVLGIMVFGCLYFVSLPFILTQENEGARRSWTFFYIGLALLLAPTFIMGFDWVVRRFSGIAASIICAGVAVVFLVGNVTVQANTESRFPGPYEYGSDSRSLTSELTASAVWLRGAAGPGNNVVAARDNGLAFGSFGAQNVSSASSSFPVWQLYFQDALPSARLLDELRVSRYRYLVVDRRMAAGELPRTGVYFVTGEPEAISTHRPPAAALEKFDHLPWATKLYSSDNLRIYRLELSQINACPALEELGLNLYPGCRTGK